MLFTYSSARPSHNGSRVFHHLNKDHKEMKSHYRPKNKSKMCDLSLSGGREELSFDAADTAFLSEIMPTRPDSASFANDYDILGWLTGLMQESPLTASLIREASETGWKLNLSDLHSGGFHLDIVTKTIELDHFSLAACALSRSQYFKNLLAINLIKALRDVWHENRWEGLEKQYDPEGYLAIERIRAADVETIAILAGWELRSAGFSEVWRHILGSEEGDMAMIFTRVIERDPASLYNGSALSLTFRQWYAEEDRVNAADHQSLEYLDEILSASGKRKPFGRKKPAETAVEMISALPDGQTYLKNSGQAVLNDPAFAGLYDPINQAHLFHLVYDLESVNVSGVSFRDGLLARKIFPGAGTTRI